jgi:hypothetical protein
LIDTGIASTSGCAGWTDWSSATLRAPLPAAHRPSGPFGGAREQERDRSASKIQDGSTMAPARKPASRRPPAKPSARRPAAKPRARAQRSSLGALGLPALEQRHLDLIGLGLVALGVFLAFPLYLGWDGGAAGQAATDGLA